MKKTLLILSLVAFGRIGGYIATDYVKAQKDVERAEELDIKQEYVDFFTNLPEGFKEEFTNGHIVGYFNNNETFRELLRIAANKTEDLKEEQIVEFTSFPPKHSGTLEEQVEAVLVDPPKTKFEVIRPESNDVN
ncbi:hypothetical protein [Bacillus litorisediminis]|uniref:hypothetical protein n=1 Tax=Bacillus litorisediminis TaxID=2922713 RepID=UPI001FAE2DF3|nr:hypothetical protein [Bacillus litorisediminis]